jgi:hypothetical protein
VIATVGDPAGRNSAWTAGADFTYQTSQLGGDKNFLVGIWGVLTSRDSLSGDRSAIGGKIDYPNDLWDVALTWKRIGESFDPSLGFVPRPGVWLASLGGRYGPRPQKWGIRQMFLELRGSVATDLDFNWESWQVTASPLDFQFESGDGFEIGVTPQGERLTEPFEVEDGVVIPVGSYGFTRGRIEVETASARRFGIDANWSFGGFYDGTLNQVEVGGIWRPSAGFNLSFKGEHNIGELPQGDFTQTLVATRVQVNLSTAIQFSTYWQYDTDSRDLGTNTRLRWSFSPLGDVFLVYNHNASDPETGSMQFKSNDLRLKVQYTFRY